MVPTDEYQRRIKKWPKKYKRELGAMIGNTRKVFLALCGDASVESLHFGFIHFEPGGVLAIDQKGGGTGLKQTRLYAYPHLREQILYLITMGDKKSQSDDIAHAKAFVDGVKRSDEERGQ